MIHSRLVKFLNKAWGIQVILSVFPVLLIIFYSFVYLLDVSSTLKVLDTNDNLATMGLDNNLIKEVGDIKENDDKTYTAEMNEINSVSVNTSEGDILLTITVTDKDNYTINTSEGSIDTSYCSLIDEISDIEDGYFTAKVGDYEVRSHTGLELFEVTVGKNGVLYVDFFDKEHQQRVKEIEEIELTFKGDNKYTYTIRAKFDKKFENMECKYCRVLPSSNLYYDTSSGVLLHNISSDFSKNFLLGSNILAVFISSVFYIILLVVCHKRNELVILQRKEPLFINMAGFSCLFLLILITFSIF